MKVYHGSSKEIIHPDFSHSRIDIDFGMGFYLTENKKMAEKWAVGKTSSVVNIYDLDLRGLKVVKLGLTKQWLEFVTFNRGFGDKSFDVTGIDVIIGPAVDDKMFNTISSYIAGFISEEQAIKYLDIAGFSNQIVLKTDNALRRLSFLESKNIYGLQKQELLKQISIERRVSNKMLKELIQKESDEEREVLLTDDYSGEEER